MQLIQPFNAQNFDPSQSVGSLPIGRHPVVIVSSEVKPNKNNDGGYLQLDLKIIDGPMQGTTGAYRLNLYHNNAQTVEIAHRQLSAVCYVTGVFQVNDSSQLHNIPFIIDVAPQKNDPQYTEVKKVFDMNGNEPGKTGQGGAAQAAPVQQQPAQQQPAQAAGAWGGQPAQQQAAPASAWGQPAQQQPAQAAPAAAAGNWQQQPAQGQAAAGGAAPWMAQR